MLTFTRSSLGILVVLVLAVWLLPVPAAAQPAQRQIAAPVQSHVQPALFTAPLSPTGAAPLQPFTLTLRLAQRPDYSGPARLRLYDAEEQPAGTYPVQVDEGHATLTVTPRGALGPQRGMLLVGGRVLSEYADLFTLTATTTIQTGQADLDALYPTIRGFLEQDVVGYELDGVPVRGYRSPDNPWLWLRDHVYQGRGYRYFEPDMTSLLDAFRRAQRPDGSFPDVLTYPALGVTAHRVETESDLEYLFVLGVYQAWQATGDTAWLHRNLEAMRRGLTYITSDPLRWDERLGLVRRPYTIDTWDFEYGPTTRDPQTGKPAPRHWIDEQTRWGIFHGDNSGLAYALRLMERIERHLGNERMAQHWQTRRRAITERLNEISWNGDFFTHFVPLTGTLDVPGVDTDAQLSLSNAYALNRELLDFEQGRRIIESYYSRRDFERAFAEWYSIDPPFPEGHFGLAGRPGERPGEYVNGGIMPLVGGELARGAFRYGAEVYGFDILRRYADVLRLTGESYLWYYPTGQPGISGPDTLSTDGWGSSAMLAALLEGAAGVQDSGSLFEHLHLSPRWSAAPAIDHVWVVARYGASNGYVAYTWQRGAQRLALDLTGSWQTARIRLLLPDEARGIVAVQVNGEAAPTELERVGSSRYAVLDAAGGNVQVELIWGPEALRTHDSVQRFIEVLRDMWPL